jgi:hypothetical protein
VLDDHLFVHFITFFVGQGFLHAALEELAAEFHQTDDFPVFFHVFETEFEEMDDIV